MSEVMTENLVVEDDKKKFDLANALRWLGCGGIVLSAIIFLLQGFDDVGDVLRNWAYLILMVALGGIGVALKYTLQDGKSARLLLGLAAAVIPIQFAQLGGMIHTLVAGTGGAGSSILESLVSVSTLSWGSVGIAGLATLALTFTVGLFAFRVLARPHATLLTMVNAAMCAMLLFPAREGVLAIAIFAAMFAAALAFDRWLSKGTPVMRTGEGRAARLTLLIPVAIFGVRASFYVSDVTALAVMFGFGSLAVLFVAAQYLQRGILRELAIFMSSSMAIMSWFVWSFEIVPADSVLKVLSLAPVVSVFHLLVSKLSEQGSMYRYISGISLLVAAIQLTVGSATLLEPTIALIFGLGVCAVGYTQQWRVPAITGAFTVFAGIAAILIQALAHIEVGTWVGLAIGGVVLVVVGSLVDRYGDVFYGRAKTSWQTLGTWS